MENKKIKIWARIGVSCEVDKATYKKFLERASYKDSDGVTHIGELTLTKKESNYIFKNGTPDGDSYIPEVIFHEYLNNTKN